MEIFNDSVVENKQVNIIYLFIFATFAAAYGIGVIYASWCHISQFVDELLKEREKKCDRVE